MADKFPIQYGKGTGKHRDLRVAENATQAVKLEYEGYTVVEYDEPKEKPKPGRSPQAQETTAS